MTTRWDGNRLRKAREANEQSTADVAGFLGVWPYTVQRWESNQSRPWPRHQEKLRAIYPTLSMPDWVEAG